MCSYEKAIFFKKMQELCMSFVLIQKKGVIHMFVGYNHIRLEPTPPNGICLYSSQSRKFPQLKPHLDPHDEKIREHSRLVKNPYIVLQPYRVKDWNNPWVNLTPPTNNHHCVHYRTPQMKWHIHRRSEPMRPVSQEDLKTNLPRERTLQPRVVKDLGNKAHNWWGDAAADDETVGGPQPIPQRKTKNLCLQRRPRKQKRLHARRKISPKDEGSICWYRKIYAIYHRSPCQAIRDIWKGAVTKYLPDRQELSYRGNWHGAPNVFHPGTIRQGIANKVASTSSLTNCNSEGGNCDMLAPSTKRSV